MLHVDIHIIYIYMLPPHDLHLHAHSFLLGQDRHVDHGGLTIHKWLWLKKNGTKMEPCGSMDQHLRNPSCLMLSHTHIYIYIYIDRFVNTLRRPSLFRRGPRAGRGEEGHHARAAPGAARRKAETGFPVWWLPGVPLGFLGSWVFRFAAFLLLSVP